MSEGSRYCTCNREAKEAASGRNSDTKLLPSYLRKPLPINPTALKTTHIARLKKEWLDEWKKSERGIATARIDESTPSSKFLKSISNPKLSREAASRVAQLRLTHIPLNGYLSNEFERSTTPDARLAAKTKRTSNTTS